MYSSLFELGTLSLLLLGSAGAARADWWAKYKRDLAPESGGIVVPLYSDAQGRYVASVGMGNQGKSGPVQNLSFVLSTSSPYTAAAGVSCPACVSEIGSSSLYDPSLSQTQVPLTGNATFALGNNSVKGGTIKEVCGFLQSNGSFWWYPNQTVVVASDSRNFFGNGASGMVGLGRSGGDASFINNVFGQHQAWQNLTIGLALNGTEAGGQVGVMDLRATDSSYYTGDIKYIPVASASDHADVPANYPADWSLKLDSWTVNAGNVKTEFTANGVAIVEPYFPEIRFPIDQAELFYRDVSGATKLSDSSDGVTWSIPCKPSLSLEVNFNGSKFTVGADLLTTGDIANNNCTGVIRGWDNPFVESYMLGKAFAQTVYIVYNANRDGNGDTIGFAPRSGSGDELIGTKLNVATVVGISVGVTIAVILLLILAFLWWRHRRTVRVMESKPIKEGKGQHKIEPYSPTSGTQLYNMGNSQSNGPYVIEHGPIGGEIGPSTTLLSSMTPEASPSAATMSHSHRRKAEEAGYISSTAGTGSISSRGARESRRPPSSGTHASGSEFIQGLPPLPASPNTPEATGLHPGRFSTVPSSPGGAVGGPGVRPATMPAAPTPGTDSSHGRHVSQMLSPQSPQIHYHIHVTPEAAAAGGFLPSTIPPGSVIHEYPNDEPAPEYTERRQSHISDVSETDIPSPPLTASSQRPLQHHT